MIGSILKFTAVAVVGAVGMAFAMHYVDNDVLADIKGELSDLVAANQEDPLAAVKVYVNLNYELWVSRLMLASNVAELDRIIAEAA